MPTYVHGCDNKECNNEWEDYYSITKAPPTTCPKCKKETAKRLISGGSGRGIVELSGNDLIAKTKEDVKKMKHRAATDENYHANIVGESKFNKMVGGK